MEIKKIYRPTIKPEIRHRNETWILTQWDLSSKINFHDIMENEFMLVETIPTKQTKMAKRLQFGSRVLIYKKSKIQN